MLFVPWGPTKKAPGLKGFYVPSANTSAIAQPEMRVLPRYFEQGSHWVEVRQGRVSIAKLDGSDAERPDITAGIVGRIKLLLAGYDLQTAGGVVKETWELHDKKKYMNRKK